MGLSMKFRSALMTSVASLALSSSAWGDQGDTYVSFFGGMSQLEETSLLHYKTDTTSNRGNNANFIPRTPFNPYVVQIYLTSEAYTVVNGTTTSTVTPTRTFVGSQSILGTQFNRNYLTYTREFAGSIGSDGWVIGASLGVELFAGLRGEVEVAFRTFELTRDAELVRGDYNRTRSQVNAIYHYTYPLLVPNPGTAKNTPAYIPGTRLGTVGKTTFTWTHPDSKLTTISSVIKSTVTTGVYAIQYNRNFHTENVAASADGDLSAFSFMANLWYDFPIGNTGITPFIGGGIGLTNLTLDYSMRANAPSQGRLLRGLAATATTTNTQTHTHIEGSGKTAATVTETRVISGTTTTISRTFITNLKTDQAVFAYQFGGGIGYEFGNGVMLSAQYRYFATDEADFGPVTAQVESRDFLIGLSIPLGRRGR